MIGAAAGSLAGGLAGFGIPEDQAELYGDRYEAVLRKSRLDLDIDPSPDLALETALTSKTTISAYE